MFCAFLNTGFLGCQFAQIDPKNETQTKSRGQAEERRGNWPGNSEKWHRNKKEALPWASHG